VATEMMRTVYEDSELANAKAPDGKQAFEKLFPQEAIGALMNDRFKEIWEASNVE
jgi:hypothetical protein